MHLFVALLCIWRCCFYSSTGIRAMQYLAKIGVVTVTAIQISLSNKIKTKFRAELILGKLL